MRAVFAGFTGLAFIAMATTAGAQSLRSAKPPAELPPSSYTASYYVDSRGCAYVRAGYGGSTSWIPRVTRDRRVVCGQTPTFAGKETTPTTTRVATAKPTETQTRVTTATPKTKPQPFTWWFTPRKTPTAKTTTIARVEVPQTTTTQQPRVKVATTTTVRKTRTQRVRGGVYAIRTGPQEVHPADAYNGRNGVIATTQATTPRTTTQITVTRQAVVVPEGYKSLLVDDKNYGLSGVGTPEGRQQMDLIWTQTMPRKLIDVTTGRDVTTQYPAIKYPYTTVVSTRSYAATSVKQPRVTPRKTRVSKPKTTTSVRKTTPVVRPKTTTTQKRKPLSDDAASPLNMESIEDMSATYDTPLAESFVQVATFGVPANATRTAARFQAAGLPVAKRVMTRGGKSYAIILLGPFADAGQLGTALQAARGEGFRDAFTVK